MAFNQKPNRKKPRITYYPPEAPEEYPPQPQQPGTRPYAPGQRPPTPSYPPGPYPPAPHSPADPYGQTQVTPSGAARQRQARRQQPPAWMLRRRPRRLNCGCLLLVFGLAGMAVLALAVYFLAPFRTNILVMGMDYTDASNSVSRTDTLVMTTFQPGQPYVGMLSIPRDLWVSIPGVGENRINTAHFFAEANQAGSGPAVTIQTVEQNFGVDVDYYVRFRFESFIDVVEAMGGIEIDLQEPVGRLQPGRQKLDPSQALNFVRHREGSDDFFRMEHGQLLIKAAIKDMMRPVKWLRIPRVVSTILRSVQTDVPMWLWPRLAMTLARVGPDHIDSRTIQRDMVTGFFTPEGAEVLGPNWLAINPVLQEMFGQ